MASQPPSGLNAATQMVSECRSGGESGSLMADPSLQGAAEIFNPLRPRLMRVAYRMLQRGEKVSVRMRRHATLRTGDADALLVSVGNGPARALGPPGAVVRTIELKPEDAPRGSAR